jgi:predicted Zn-dependent peptidase
MAPFALAVVALGLAAAIPGGSGPGASGPAEIVLGNGLRVDVVPIAGARVFALAGRIDAGFAHDPPGCPGLSAVAAEWLAWPLIGEDARSPVIRWTSPAEPSSAVSPRWLEFRAAGLLGEEDVLLEALAGRLSSAARAARDGLPPERWERFRAAAASRARAAAGTVEGQLWGHALASLYPQGSPLASPPWGPAGRVSGDAAGLQGFLRAHVTPARTRVVIAGSSGPTELRPRLERTLGRVPAGAASPAALSLPAAVHRQAWTEVRLPRSDLKRDHLLVACPLDRSGSGDDLGARALVFLLEGSGASGRLARDLVEPGLALTVRAGLAGDGASALLFARTAAEPADTPDVLERARHAFDALAHGIVEGEVAAFLARERAEQESGDPVRCAERRLLGQPGCGEPLAPFRPGDLADAARRLLAAGAPLALVLGPGESSLRRGAFPPVRGLPGAVTWRRRGAVRASGSGTGVAATGGGRSTMSLKQGFSYLGVLVVGVAGGWVAGMLTAPASGDETRRRLSWKLDDGKNKMRREAQRVVDQTASRLEHGIEAGKQKIEQALSS